MPACSACAPGNPVIGRGISLRVQHMPSVDHAARRSLRRLEVLGTATPQLARLGTALHSANAAASASTTEIPSAGADEISAAVSWHRGRSSLADRFAVGALLSRRPSRDEENLCRSAGRTCIENVEIFAEYSPHCAVTVAYWLVIRGQMKAFGLA
ncbi:MAG: PE family protein [Mycobacterium sp.]|nr:MAG: PE family protein [Mycobacterium sp.]